MRSPARLLALALAAAVLPACSGLGYRRPITVEHPRVALPSGVEYQEVLPGLGEEAEPDDTVTVDYTAWLASEAEGGAEFDSSHHRGIPLVFALDAAPLAAWGEGIPGMREGGRRKLFVPSELAYGGEGVPGLVPPDSPLVFLIELIAVGPPPAAEPAPAPPPDSPPAAPEEDAQRADEPAPEPPEAMR